MSAEEKKEQHKAVRIISIIALVVGIAVFLHSLLYVPPTIIILVRGSIGRGYLYMSYFVSFVSHLLFRFITIYAFVLSLVTLLFERKKYYRWLPFVFVVAGIIIYFSCYLLLYIYLKFYWPPDPGPPPPPPPL